MYPTYNEKAVKVSVHLDATFICLFEQEIDLSLACWDYKFTFSNSSSCLLFQLLDYQ